MALDIANTVLASAPYYDDYSEDKKYHRILFRPSVPLQARELNQLQSILQNQIERFGDGVFRSGTIVKGGGVTTIDDAKFISVQNNSDTENPDYAGAILVGATSGVQAEILTGIDGFSASSRPSKFFIKYLNTGRNANGDIIETFVEGVNGNPGETLQIYGKSNLYKGQIVLTVTTSLVDSDFESGGGFAIGTEFIGGDSSATGKVVDGTAATDTIILENVRGVFKSGETIYSKSNNQINAVVSSVGSALVEDSGTLIGTSRMLSGNSSLGYTALGSAYCVNVPEAIVYQKGFFVKTDDQVLVVNPSAGGAAAAAGKVVGYETDEVVIDEFADNTLYDNAEGFTNEAAPGAHRLQLLTALVSYNKADIPEETNFFPIAEFGPSGVLYVKDTPQFGAIERTLAKRTYDESGHYSVKPFNISTSSGTKIIEEDDDTVRLQDFNYRISDGLAYVGGIEVTRLSESELSIDRGIETASDDNQILSTNFGDYVFVQEVRGIFESDTFPTVTLYNTAQRSVTNNKVVGSSLAGSAIGTANIRGFEYDSGTKGSPSGRYRIQLIDIKMNDGFSFKDVRSVFFNDGSDYAYADIATDPNLRSVKTVSIGSGGTGYVVGDVVALVGGNGDPAFVEITTVVGNGVVSAISLAEGGSYTAAPSGTVSTSYAGNGSGLTVTIASIENKALTTLQETQFSKGVLPLGRSAIKNLQDASGSEETSYYYSAIASANVGTNGIVSIDLGALSNTELGFTDTSNSSEAKVDLIAFGANVETANLAGTITAVSNSTVVGVATEFTEDFQVGEIIKSGANSALVLAIPNNTTLVVNGAVTFGTGSNYTRLHPKGSLISLNTTKRSLGSIDVGNTSFTINIGANTAASVEAKAKVLVRKTLSSPLQKDVTRNVKVRVYEGVLTGRVSASGNTITSSDPGVSTQFTQELNVGNILKIGSEIRKVTAIANSTQLSVNSAFSSGVANASSNTAFSVTNPSGVWSLGHADVFRVNSIKQTSSIYGSTDEGADVSNSFVVELGQKDTFYDHASIRLVQNSGLNVENKPLLVDIDVLSVNTSVSSGYFTVESYPIDDSVSANNATIKTWEIPAYYSESAKRVIDLRDTIDFRPVKNSTANLTANAAIATVNPVFEPAELGLDEFNTDTTEQKPATGYNLQYNMSYYLPRKDLVVVSNKGSIEVLKGTASLEPKFADYDTDAVMPIAQVDVPAYPSLTLDQLPFTSRRDYAIRIKNLESRRFTMKDIAAIEQRVSTLEYTAALTQLEKQALATAIPAEDGTDRFKNGIFVDGFDNTFFTNPQAGHNLVIDRQNSVGRPNFEIETVDLQLSTNNATSVAVINDESNKIAYNKDFLTITYSEELIVQQAAATKELFLDSDVRFTHGTVQLSKDRFSDVKQLAVYTPSLVGGASGFDSFFESLGANSDGVIYPKSRTVKFIARGLMPNARHYISVGKRDFSLDAVQGRIPAGSTVIPSNVIIDGLTGSPIYSDNNGVVYGVVNIPGDIPVGTHAFNVTGAHIDSASQFSFASAGLVIAAQEQIVDPPKPTKATDSPPISVGLKADFDIAGALSIDDSVAVHTLTFTDRTNRGLVAPVDGVLVTPTNYEWTFATNSTAPVVVSKLTESAAGPHTITYKIPSNSETIGVKLKVWNGSNVSEITKRVTLKRHTSAAKPMNLIISRALPGNTGPQILASSGASVKPQDGSIDLRFTAIRESGNLAFIEISAESGFSGAAGISNTTAYFEYANVGVTSQSYSDPSNGILQLKWSGGSIPSGVLRIDVKYVGNNDIQLTRFVEFTDTVAANTVFNRPTVPSVRNPIVSPSAEQIRAIVTPPRAPEVFIPFRGLNVFWEEK
jgi:hypothetical protein